MEDVRSALTAYVTEGEPPIGLTGDEVLAAARLSRRRYLLTGAVALAVVVLALGLAVVVQFVSNNSGVQGRADGAAGLVAMGNLLREVLHLGFDLGEVFFEAGDFGAAGDHATAFGHVA